MFGLNQFKAAGGDAIAIAVSVSSDVAANDFSTRILNVTIKHCSMHTKSPPSLALSLLSIACLIFILFR